MLWIKAFHLVFMVTWFAGLFYLPRLFVYHAMTEDSISNERFKIMERKLYYGIMTPGAVMTIALGIGLLAINSWEIYSKSGWLHAKLGLIAILVSYHFYCGILLSRFKQDRNLYSHVFYRWFNELPVVILMGVVILAVVKPF